MKTLKELADIGTAAAQKVMGDLNNPGRQAFAQAVKDQVLVDANEEIAKLEAVVTKWRERDRTPQLLPLSIAGPVPAECVRYYFYFSNGEWFTDYCESCDVTHFADIRLPAIPHKPTWTLPPPPEGRPLPTTPDPYAELKAAHAAGKVIQSKDEEGWLDDHNPKWLSHGQYRIKPEPVLVPLTIDDIRATDEFRHKESHIVETADHWNCEEVTLSWSDNPSYEVLATHYLRRQHGSTEWKPCIKEAQQ